MQLSISRPLATSCLLWLAVCMVVHSLIAERVFRPGQSEEDHTFVTDPSAKVDGIFKKVGEMTFIMHSDPLDGDFKDGSETQEDDKRRKRNAVIETRFLWSEADVPYHISSLFGDRDRTIILSAMRHWEEKTCIRFRPKQQQDSYYIFILTGERGVCVSFVGRISQSYQPQGVTLGQTCVHFPTVVRLLGHAIGFHNEHRRPDRDEHIKVFYENIEEGLEQNFDKIPPGSSNLLGYGYDYASIFHYNADEFSTNGRDTIIARDSTIPVGNAGELSPLDIAKANKLYSCGPNSTWPPISTVVPTFNLSLPSGISCGQVSNGATNGSYRSPGFPEYMYGLHCAYVIEVPKGYYVNITLRNFALQQSTGCTKDYVQLYYGTELTSSYVVTFIGINQTCFCDNHLNRFFTILDDDILVTVLLHTDSSGSAVGRRGLDLTFILLDVDECQSNRCHKCENLIGGFECICREGYYHSAAAGTCYDVNECAYDSGGCQHMCSNSGGSYQCLCNTSYYLQSDGKSCAKTPPTPPPSPSITTVVPTPPSVSCGQTSDGALNGSFRSPGYPEYRHNLRCEYVIKIPKGYHVNITMTNLTLEESTGCMKDYVQFHFGTELTSSSIVTFGRMGQTRFCPNNSDSNWFFIKYNVVTIVYHTDSSGSGEQGLDLTFIAIDVNECVNNNGGCKHKCKNSPGSYQCQCNTSYYLQSDGKSCSTIPPPTTPPPSVCGELLNTESGSFQTPNWPETYPVNIDCEWKIQLPDKNKLVEITCDKEPFGIAGALPECPKDHLKIYDGHSKQDTFYGPFCHLTKPGSMTMSSSLAMAVFHAGPAHNHSRNGFKCTFQSINPPMPQTTLLPTAPPTTAPTTTPTQSTKPPLTTPPPSICGELLNTESGSFQTPYWSETYYPVNIDCEWKIQLPDKNKLVEITCNEDPFGIAGALPKCLNDYLKIYDGHSKQDNFYGPFCHLTKPGSMTMSSSLAMAVFHAGPAHNHSQNGFKCTFQSVNAPMPQTTLPPTAPPTTAPTTTPTPSTKPPPTTPPPSICGELLNTESGSFQTPYWPETYYPVNIDCEWKIQLPDKNKWVEITCNEDPFGIAGALPECLNDHLKIYDGHSKQDAFYGPFCNLTKPAGSMTMSSSLAMAVFHAGPAHNHSRNGFKCTFRSVNAYTLPPTLPPTTTAPTTTPTQSTKPPPTTPPPSICGELLNTESGSFQTPNWPETYPVNIDCEWRIELPDGNKLVEITCNADPFGIAGALPECPKDHLKIYDGHSKQDTFSGPFCHFTKPGSLKMSSNMAMAVFHAGPVHNPSRKGFKCTFRSVNAPMPQTTLPPTDDPPTIPPTPTSQCGGTLRAASGSIQTPNWPETYPVNIDCTWTIELPDSSKRVEITFESGFGIAGQFPSCVKDHLHIYDSSTGAKYGPFCHWATPNLPLMTSNQARLEFHAGPSHNPSRRGFKANYRSVSI